MTSAPNKWFFWIDRGGTFTDVVARRPDGALVTHKLLSRNPGVYDDAVVQGIRDIIGIAPGDPLPTSDIEEIRVGTTVGTNALLEKQGEPTLLLITRGFHDLLRIGYQNRPDIFALDIELPEMLYTRVIEVDERMDADGTVLTALDRDALRDELSKARADGFTACAVALLHSSVYPDHEIAVGQAARAAGFEQISLSHEVSPGMKLVRRGDTAVVDAYISPVLGRYVDRLTRDLEGARLWFMQSAGGLVAGEFFRGRDCLLSGPAGGVIGAVETGRRAGLDKIIGFDMGGTSTDVSHYAGDLERVHESEIAGVRLQIPMLHIETVAAGGGSILEFDGERFRVGPRSAGADPGPACYRRGGPLTVTDANLLLGRLQVDSFPRIFGQNRDQPLDAAVVQKKFKELANDLAARGLKKTPEEIAAGFFLIANENMARAIKKISVQKGYDLTDYTLNCFGGAGGQHACAIASLLGIRRVLLHPAAGVLSAYGIGMADLRMTHAASIELNLTDANCADRLDAVRAQLEAKGAAQLRAQGCTDDNITYERRALLRYAGADTHLDLALGTTAELRADFLDAHRERFGFIQEGAEIVVQEIMIVAVGTLQSPRASERIVARDAAESKPTKLAADAEIKSEARQTRIFADGQWFDAPVYIREKLKAGFSITGPAVIAGSTDTALVDPGWSARINEQGDLLLEQMREKETGSTATAKANANANKAAEPDPILLEVYHNTFESIADEMGLILQSTATSVNIKERLDYSCALFNEAGDLVASAPHIPVHLGSMSDSVRAVRAKFVAGPAARDEPAASIRPGDVFVTNNPYAGGTHLPDVTVITPFFHEDRIAFYLAARGHHADIGGLTPGSMPAHSQRIDEEGVLLDCIRLVRDGKFLADELQSTLTGGTFPARNSTQNLADLGAQVAANQRGARLLEALIAERGAEQVRAYMSFIQTNAARAVRRIIAELNEGENVAPLDDGSQVQVRVTKTGDQRVQIDFSGTSPTTPGNLNAPEAVVRSAILYVFRTLVRDSIPLNEGCLEPIDILLPADSLLRPAYPAAVVGGNVETSQIIVDALYAALGRLAASQGTMNNLTFGNDRYQYYETICGGAGAGPDFNGASAVHSHMTNSRLTDPEVLETRFPVLVMEFSLRRDSGGTGRFSGGDGVRRRLRFREAMRVSILSGRRKHPPRGLAGGGDGQSGANWLLRPGDQTKPEEEEERERIALDFRDEVDVLPGDEILIETPGGGGYGR